MPSEAFLDIDRVAVRYGSTPVLHDLSLAVGRGELVALLGSSGCGKTTLLRTIAGFLSPTSGRLRIGERDITRLAPDRRDMAMVFQSYALWPHMSVAQNIGYGLKLGKSRGDPGQGRGPSPCSGWPGSANATSPPFPAAAAARGAG